MFPEYPEWEAVFRKPREMRIVGLPYPTVNAFIKEHQLAPPRVVYAKALPECKPRLCLLNVEAQVKNNGGKMQVGWMFRETRNTSLKSEAHAVWIKPDGYWLDVTPQRWLERETCLFSPDDKVAEKRGWTLSHMTHLTEDPKERAINNFVHGLRIIKSREFKGINMELDINKEEVLSLASNYGLPEIVALYLYNCEIEQ